MSKVIRVGELKKLLQMYSDDLPVIITDEGKGHEYGIYEEDITVTTGAYFGNDMTAWDEFSEDENYEQHYLNLGMI